MTESDSTPALVIGLSIHGLAVARALARAGIEVHALEQDARAPASRTRYATVHVAPGVNSDRLADVLLDFAGRVLEGRRAVLFPTSDNMVRAIARNWDRLADHYLLSWRACRDQVLELQHKDGIAGYCEKAGIRHPASVVVADGDQARQAARDLRFPSVAKPVRPLSSFKAIRVENAAELTDLTERYPEDLPFVVQEWIEGGESELFFCTVYAEEGRSLVSFQGQKIRSVPSPMGMGSAVRSVDCPEVCELADQFLGTTRLSGPVAIEFKRDPEGRFWLIEPNVGRTEYSVDLLIQHGVNLPLIEYERVTGRDASLPGERIPTLWIDGERDPKAYPSLCLASRSLAPEGRRLVFGYSGHGDRGPLLVSLGQRLSNLALKLPRKLLRLFGGGDDIDLRRFNALSELPEEALEWLSQLEKQNLFYGLNWFENYEREVAATDGRIEWNCFYDATGDLLGVWPFVRKRTPWGDLLEGMANYYSPYFTLTMKAGERYPDRLYFDALRAVMKTASRLSVFPLAPSEPFNRVIGRRWVFDTIAVIRDIYTVNWFQPVKSVEAYLGSRSSQLRNTLKRRRRKLAREVKVDLRMYIEEGPGLEEAIGEYFQVYAASWKRVEAYPEFIANLARLSARRGWLRLGILYVNGEPAAAQLWLIQNRIAHIYKLAYDDRFSKWSVGSQLTAWMVEYVIERDGVRKLDYLTGNDAYKESWMEYNRPLHRIWLVNLLHVGGIAYLLRSLLSRIWRQFHGRKDRDLHDPRSR